MSKVLLSEFLDRLSRECHEAEFTWYSIVEGKKSDIIVANSKLEGRTLHFSNRVAKDHYGLTRDIYDLPVRKEWIDAIYIGKSLRGPSQLILRTYI